MYHCPSCKSKLDQVNGNLECKVCDKEFISKNNFLDFLGNFEIGEMGEFFDHSSKYYESTPYLTHLYNYFGSIPLINDDNIVSDFNNLLSEDMELLIQPKDGIILDVACGTGLFSRPLAKIASKVYGIDISVGMLDVAQQYAINSGLKNIEFIRASAEEIPFDDNTFDGLTCCGGLQLFQDINLSLKEMYRVLKSNAWMAGFTYIKRINLEDESLLEILENEKKVHIFELHELMDIIKAVGFSNYKYKTYGSMIIFGAEKS